MKHVDGGWRCLAYHGPGEPQCIVCDTCGQYVQPHRMNEKCPGPPEPDKTQQTFTGPDHEPAD
jgi:hypothetical protein